MSTTFSDFLEVLARTAILAAMSSSQSQSQSQSQSRGVSASAIAVLFFAALVCAAAGCEPPANRPAAEAASESAAAVQHERQPAPAPPTVQPAVQPAVEPATHTASPAVAPAATPAATQTPPKPDWSEVPRPPSRESGFRPVDDRIVIARAMLRDESWERAETALRLVAKDHPDDAQTNLLLGFAIQKQKRYSEALPYFTKVLAAGQAFPEIDSVFYLRGWCSYYLGEVDDARAAFEEHLRRVPNTADSHFALGLIAFDGGELEKAEASFRTAIDLQKDVRGGERDLAKAWARLGETLAQRGDLEGGRAALARAVELYPDHDEAWAMLARLLDRLGRSDEAERARTEERAAKARAGG
jgi:tetratricopeptide (TPR) repeat protein